jgi:hypothetical protein
MRRSRALLPLTFLILAVAPRILAIEFTDIYAWIGRLADTHINNAGQTVFPTLRIPAGGEFEGMGQAYTAVSRDISFFDANPAGSSTLEYTELTFVHNDWIQDTYLDSVYYTIRLENFGLALGGKFLHVAFTGYDQFTQQTASGRYSEGTIGLNASYNMLSSYEFPGVSLGATLKTAYRYVPPAVAPEQSAVGFAADLGVLTRFNFLKNFSSRSPNFAVGASARNLGFPVGGEPLPSEITAGIAYSPARPVTIAADLFQPISLVRTIDPDPMGGAVGVSVQITPFVSARTGLLLRWGNSRFSVGATVDLADISIDINMNLDLVTQFSEVDRFSVQARLNLGDRQRKHYRALVDSYYLSAWINYTSGDFERALRNALAALEIDSDFTPASDLLELLEQAIALDADLRAIYAEADTTSGEAE